jgi:hypothetical protein
MNKVMQRPSLLSSQSEIYYNFSMNLENALVDGGKEKEWPLRTIVVQDLVQSVEKKT